MRTPSRHISYRPMVRHSSYQLRRVRHAKQKLNQAIREYEEAKAVYRSSELRVASPSRFHAAGSMSPDRFWGLMDEIGTHAHNLKKVLPPKEAEAFADTFFDLASKISGRLSKITGEQVDEHDYAAWGVVSQGRKVYQDMLSFLKDDPEEAAAYITEEYDGEEFGGDLTEFVY